MGWGNVKEAALACGLPVQSWRGWERDNRMPRDLMATTMKVANRTGCDPDWLSGMAASRAQWTPPDEEMVRRQGLEPRTRWFGVEDDENDSLATVLPFTPGRIRRTTIPRRVIHRGPYRTIDPILLHCAVSS
jgi:hypothetical protein